MASIERKISGTFAPVPGGYAQQINEQTTLLSRTSPPPATTPKPASCSATPRTTPH